MFALWLALALTNDHLDAWTEVIAPSEETRFVGNRLTITISNEFNTARATPAGRVDGSRAYIYWPERLVESPTLTCIDLATKSIVWQQTLSPRTTRHLFTRSHIIADEPKGEGKEGRQLQWYDREDGVPGMALAYDERGGFHIIHRKWLVDTFGGIRDAESGVLTGTVAVPIWGESLIVGDSLVVLVFDTSKSEFEYWLRQIDLKTGQVIVNHPLREHQIPGEMSLLATDAESAILSNTNLNGTDRTLIRLNLTQGTIVWRTPIPRHAPVRFVAAPEGLIDRRNPLGEIVHASGLDIDWNDGTLEFPPTRPSPISRFDLHVPPLPHSERLGLRVVDRDLAGWFHLRGTDSQLIRIDPSSPQPRWSTRVNYPHQGSRWLPELGSSPQYAMFPNLEELQIVDLASGELSTISATTLGLPLAPRILISQTTETTPGKTDTLQSVEGMFTLRRIFLLIGLAALILWAAWRAARSGKHV